MKLKNKKLILFLLSLIPNDYLYRSIKENEKFTTIYDIKHQPIYENDIVKHKYHPSAMTTVWMVCKIVWNRTGFGLKHLAHYEDESLTKRKHEWIIEHNDFVRNIWGCDLKTMSILKQLEIKSLNL